MNRLSFIFFCVLYMVISISSFANGITPDVQALACMTVIALVGIPHGAIDHILYLKMSPIKPWLFYSLYLLLMAVYLLCWFTIPVASMVAFMLLSAYHFGESQLGVGAVHIGKLRTIAYLAWGCSILTGLVVYNYEELAALFGQSQDLQILMLAFPLLTYKIIFIFSTILICSILYYNYNHQVVSGTSLLRELYTLTLIHITFYILPILPAFTLYFAILHSAGVLIEEFGFLRKSTTGLTVSKFALQLLPYTFVSLLGGSGLYLLIHYDLLKISYVFLAIVLISILTLPHSVVMNKFYQKSQ